MSTRKLVITAVPAGSSQSEAARRYGVSQGWVSRLMARYAAEGDAAFETRSRRPHTTPSVTPPAVVDEILRQVSTCDAVGRDAPPYPARSREGSVRDAR